jgi:hypothetical protein
MPFDHRPIGSMVSSSSSRSSQVLPAVSIQPTYREVVADVFEGAIPFENIWISCYKTGEPSIHAKANVVLDEKDRNAVRYSVSDGDFVVESEGVYPHDVSQLFQILSCSSRPRAPSILPSFLFIGSLPISKTL